MESWIQRVLISLRVPLIRDKTESSKAKRETNRRRRGPLVAVRILKSSRPSQVEAGGQGAQNDLGHRVAAANGVFQDPKVAAVLDRRRDLGAVALNLVSRHLEHLVAVLGAGRDAGAAADGLVSVRVGLSC